MLGLKENERKRNGKEKRLGKKRGKKITISSFVVWYGKKKN